MAGHADIYRALVRLYPKEFRRHYGDDLVQTFVDLLGRNGASRTWPRVTLDLVITVPRYRLETVMSQRQSTATLYLAIAALTGAGILSMLAGFYAGAILLVVAFVLGIVERGRLALAQISPVPGEVLCSSRLRQESHHQVAVFLTQTKMGLPAGP